MTHPEVPPFLAEMTPITTFAEVNEILRSPHFAAGRFEDESLPFRGRSLLELDGDEHRERRRLESALFTKDMLGLYDLELLEHALARCLNEAADEGRGPDGLVRADLVRITRRTVLQVTPAIIGLDDVDTGERLDLLEQCMATLTDAFDVKYSTRDHAEVVEDGLAAKERFVEHFYGPAVARRAGLLAKVEQGDLSEEDLPTDLLMLMLRHHREDWDADLLVREAILYLTASTDTTSNAVNHAVVELLRWLEDHSEDRDRVADNAFLRGVCNEVLRLHQNVPALARRATRDITLSTGRLVRSGEIVALMLGEANVDPKAFGEDADRFNPRREVGRQARPYGLTFGTGRHLCIGLPLVTTTSGNPAGDDGSDRAMLKMLRALIDAGVEFDRDRPIRLKPTAEDVHESLPILLARR